MNGKTAVVMLSGLLFACAPTQPPPPAPEPPPPPVAAAAPPPAAIPVPADRIVAIRRASCGAFMALSPDDRNDAAMFYVGYQASRLRAGTINVALVPSIVAEALSYCTSAPNLPVAQAFADAYIQSRQ